MSIADFCAPRKKLIIELDGSQHFDAERTAYFGSKGYRVLRFWNNAVTNNLESVLTVIWDALNTQADTGIKTGQANTQDI